MRTQRSAGEAFQTYIIRNKNDYSRTGSDRWCTYQSNVHGVVVAANDVPTDTIGAYPRTLGTVIEHFIQSLIVAESDFVAAEHIDVMQFLGSDKRISSKLYRLEYIIFWNISVHRKRDRRLATPDAVMVSSQQL